MIFLNESQSVTLPQQKQLGVTPGHHIAGVPTAAKPGQPPQ